MAIYAAGQRYNCALSAGFSLSMFNLDHRCVCVVERDTLNYALDALLQNLCCIWTSLLILFTRKLKTQSIRY